MAGFDWNKYPSADAKEFSWDDHPVVKPPEQEMGIMEKLDSVTGAPTRAAVHALQKGENPIPVAWKQFAADPKTAPTGKDIMVKAGVSDAHRAPMTAQQLADFDKVYNPSRYAIQSKQPDGYKDAPQGMSPAEALGAAAEMTILDPTNALVAGVAKVGGRAIKGASAALREGAATKIGAFAEKAAVNATGATGAQASKFADDAGRQLLDRKLVRFGDSASNISERTAKAVEQANAEIDASLKALDAKGVKVDANEIYNQLRAKINSMKSDPSKADIVKHLESELDNLIGATDVKGTANFSASEAEKVKRGYSRKAGNWADQEKGQAGKEMYHTFKNSVEGVAEAADPKIASKFKEGKETHGLLAPIQEAAERRAATTAQSPAGGLLDAATVIATGDPVVGLPAVAGRRFLAPRIASSVAVVADRTSKALKRIPSLAALEGKQPAAFAALTNVSMRSGKYMEAGAAAKSEPKKGPEMWAMNGFAKLAEQDKNGLLADPNKVEKILASKEGKKLLIQASDLEPGSKAMQNVYAKINERFSKGEK